MRVSIVYGSDNPDRALTAEMSDELFAPEAFASNLKFNAIEHRQQKSFTDPGHGKDRLELGHTVQDVDEIDPLHPLVIALVNAIDTQKASPTLRIRVHAHQWPLACAKKRSR